MAEPTLGEIDGGRIDPEIGTGQPAVIYDDSQLLRSINENAQFKAQNDWNKYQQFLGDYETRLKNQQEIADKEVSEADREYLKKRSVDLFKDVANDPYKIYSPEFNTKLSGLRADATASKQDRDYAEKTMQFMLASPDEWGTDENKQMVRDFMNNQTLEKGGRKAFMLNQADNVDYMAYFNTLKEGSKSNRFENELGEDGVMYNREFSKYDKDKYLEKVKLSYESNPKIKAKADRDYNSLPPDIKGQFKDAGDYWNQFGAKHFLAGDEKEVKISEKVAGVPNYLDKRRLEHQIANDNANLRLREEELRFNKQHAKDVLDAKGNIIGDQGVSPFKSILTSIGDYNKPIPIANLAASQVAAINPNWVNKDGEINKDIERHASITIGTDNEGNFGAWVYEEGMGAGSKKDFIRSDRMNANAASWMATFGKERKGQDVYPYDVNSYNQIEGTRQQRVMKLQEAANEKAKTNKPKSTFVVLPKAQLDKLDAKGKLKYYEEYSKSNK